MNTLDIILLCLITFVVLGGLILGIKSELHMRKWRADRKTRDYEIEL